MAFRSDIRRVRTWKQLAVDLGGVGMPELLEDDVRSPPGIAGGVAIAGGILAVPKVGQCFGFVEAVAEIAPQLERALVAFQRLLEVPQVVVNVTDAVPGRGLAVMIIKFLVQGESILAFPECA